MHRIGFQEPMDRLRVEAGALRQPLRCPAGRRGVQAAAGHFSEKQLPDLIIAIGLMNAYNP
jgi:hypothetical protein